MLIGRLQQLLQRIWLSIRSEGERAGFVLIAVGSLLVLALLLLILIEDPRLTLVVALFGVALGCISIGLGLMSVGTAQKSDEKHMELLSRIDGGLLDLLSNMDAGDKVEVGGKELLNVSPILNAPPTDTPKAANIMESRMLAQKRLDEDAKRTGRLRGELYQLPDGKWAIYWGGKHPL